MDMSSAQGKERRLGQKAEETSPIAMDSPRVLLLVVSVGLWYGPGPSLHLLLTFPGKICLVVNSIFTLTIKTLLSNHLPQVVPKHLSWVDSPFGSSPVPC